MKKWIAVLVVVLSAAMHSASAQEATRRGEFELPVPTTPAVPETTTPAPVPHSDPMPGAPAGVPAADYPDKPLPHPALEPMPMSKMPTTSVPAATSGFATVQAPGCATPGCAGCQATCQRSCCEKLAAWLCHHRQKTPDCCYRVDRPDAQLYTYFLDYPCRNASITAVGPATTCQCKKPFPWEGCFFGQLLGNGNLCCH